MTEENNVININGTDYVESDLSDKQKYAIAQIKDLQKSLIIYVFNWIKFKQVLLVL